MLSALPGLLFLSPFAPFLIRIALAGTLAVSVSARVRTSHILSLAFIEGIVAGLLTIGLLTQVAAIGAVVVGGLWLAFPRFRPVARSTAILFTVMACTLIITGAGALAFDLPL